MTIKKLNEKKENEKFINKVYHDNIYNIIEFELDQTYKTINNNIIIKENYFKINNISPKNLIKIYDYFKNMKLEIITLISYFNNFNFKINQYNYKTFINYTFNLIFKYYFLDLINLFYYNLINENINLKI